MTRGTDVAAQKTRFFTAALSIRHMQVGFLRWRKAMNTIFRLYRPSCWTEFKRYFAEWRQCGLLRREMRMLSNRECEDIGLRPTYHDDVGRWFK